MKQFFGKYRGKVTATKDPLHLGRVQVQVPAIFGEGRHSWAMPCTPYAGQDIGLFMVPPVNTNIWVEFEGGDPDYPIWSGCFWGEGELPKAAQVEQPEEVQVFRTAGVTLTVSREKNKEGVTLEVDKPVVDKPLKLIYNPAGIELNHNNKMTARFITDGQTLELKHGDTSTVTLTADKIQLKQSAIEAVLTSNSIDLTCNPATVKLSTASGIELANSPATAKLSSSGIELSSTPATVKLSPAAIELSNGAANVKLSPASVNVNNGALEVI
ncbi:phage baseplate assembly protein V [Nodosilinea sp. P-1105]|uniref:phage baseplate assembly protein V n=1 Tax=Nodosilinea sp. P-1105 TaxID=2546229 RepID=UPI00146CE95F|nr:phage baseplate assembly protein V [Nodosilinea sp. P-1105]NMF85092.1 hypothetical protein [Nodosilinea sp. P-1105]